MALRLGIVTPVIHINPRFGPPNWESTGSIDDVITVAKAAEADGYEWVSASEHVGIPEEATGARGPRYWDPITALSFMAANTTRIRLLSHVVVLSYHHPLEIVKRWGTLDVASGGRVILGVGVGSLKQEFDTLGHEFDGRGPRGDDSIRAIRASWGVRVPSYRGTHFDFADLIVEPSGMDRPVEIWIGGRTRRSLRRAIELGDAWIPFKLKLDELRSMLADPEIKDLMARRHSPLDLIFPPEPPVDPVGEPETVRAFIASYVDAGATGFSMRFDHESRDHYIEQMGAFTEIVATL
jgi:probable F420-dependent oxidoreductase